MHFLAFGATGNLRYFTLAYYVRIVP